jgi:hypothetical protein
MHLINVHVLDVLKRPHDGCLTLQTVAVYEAGVAGHNSAPKLLWTSKWNHCFVRLLKIMSSSVRAGNK